MSYNKIPKNIYQEVTDKIVKTIESGNFEKFIQPWTARGNDRNLVTKKPYRGINTLLVAFAGLEGGYYSNLWLTYKQAQDLKASIKKGETGTHIVFFQPVDIGKNNIETEDISKDEKNNSKNHNSYIILKFYTIFNIEQTTLDLSKYNVEPKEFNAIEELEKLFDQIPIPVIHGGDKACYSPSEDRILLPIKTSFDSEANYYAVRFHETAHATGHETRLNRQLKNRFGTGEYAMEELVAEITSAFLCAEFQIEGKIRHEGYINSWLQVLKNDNSAIFKASSLAQEASDYILAFPKFKNNNSQNRDNNLQ